MKLLKGFFPSEVFSDLNTFRMGRHKGQYAAVIKARTILSAGKAEWGDEYLLSEDRGKLTSFVLLTMNLKGFGRQDTQVVCDRNHILSVIFSNMRYIQAGLPVLEEMSKEIEALESVVLEKDRSVNGIIQGRINQLIQVRNGKRKDLMNSLERIKRNSFIIETENTCEALMAEAKKMLTTEIP